MDDQALMAAIVADPEDDLPRLAYADWLDENGDDARAEFIRCQIELARTDWADDRHAELTARCAEPGRRRREGQLGVGGFERGFPRRVWLPRHLIARRDFVSLERLLDKHPLREIEANMVGAASPSLQRFPHSSLFPDRGSSPLERLAAWPSLSRFASLSITGFPITGGPGDFQPGVEALAASPHAGRLASLRLTGCLLGEDAVRALAESPTLTALRSLDVRRNVPLHDRPAVFLETTLPERLEEIDGIDLETAGQWLRRPGCKLHSLGVTLDPPNDHSDYASVGSLVGAPGLRGLRRLTLEYDGPALWEDRAPARGETIALSGVRDLLESPGLSELKELNFRGVWLAAAELTGLVSTPVMRRLVALRIQRGRVETLLPMRPLMGGSLRRLDLSHNYMRNAACEEVASWPELARLHELRLGGVDLGEAGLAAVRASPFHRPWLRLNC